MVLDEAKLRELSYMLECAVQRRFPRGLRMRLQCPGSVGVPPIFTALCNAGLSITRCGRCAGFRICTRFLTHVNASRCMRYDAGILSTTSDACSRFFETKSIQPACFICLTAAAVTQC
jgi:hypothetical protein